MKMGLFDLDSGEWFEADVPVIAAIYDSETQ
jgi:hypothetical protein